MSENQLTEQLLLILKDAGHNEPIGLLTTENRDTLAVAYEKLVEGKFHDTIQRFNLLTEIYFHHFYHHNRSSK